jgi:hypothetical protein
VLISTLSVNKKQDSNGMNLLVRASLVNNAVKVRG